jgi:hypothetical protein
MEHALTQLKLDAQSLNCHGIGSCETCRKKILKNINTAESLLYPEYTTGVLSAFGSALMFATHTTLPARRVGYPLIGISWFLRLLHLSVYAAQANAYNNLDSDTCKKILSRNPLQGLEGIAYGNLTSNHPNARFYGNSTMADAHGIDFWPFKRVYSLNWIRFPVMMCGAVVAFLVTASIVATSTKTNL